MFTKNGTTYGSAEEAVKMWKERALKAEKELATSRVEEFHKMYNEIACYVLDEMFFEMERLKEAKEDFDFVHEVGTRRGGKYQFPDDINLSKAVDDILGTYSYLLNTYI